MLHIHKRVERQRYQAGFANKVKGDERTAFMNAVNRDDGFAALQPFK